MNRFCCVGTCWRYASERAQILDKEGAVGKIPKILSPNRLPCVFSRFEMCSFASVDVVFRVHVCKYQEWTVGGWVVGMISCSFPTLIQTFISLYIREASVKARGMVVLEGINFVCAVCHRQSFELGRHGTIANVRRHWLPSLVGQQCEDAMRPAHRECPAEAFFAAYTTCVSRLSGSLASGPSRI